MKFIASLAIILLLCGCAQQLSRETESQRQEESSAEPPASESSPPPTAPSTPKDEPKPAATGAAANESEQPEQSTIAEQQDPAPSREESEAKPAAQPKPEQVDAEEVRAAPAPTSIRGTLSLQDDDQRQPADLADAVIYFLPNDTEIAPAASVELSIVTENKRFQPDVAVVPVGSTIRFPNADDILHNVFSVSSAADFDLGLYGGGESKSVMLEEPGLVLVHCNVHHAMQADILVLATPYFARVAEDGRFQIDGIDSRQGQLVAWHPRADEARWSVTVEGDLRRDLSLAINKPRVPDHLNKFGESYRPTRNR